MAADSAAASNGVPLARASRRKPIALLDAKLPAQWSRGNPIDLIGDAPPQRFADRHVRPPSPIPASTRCWRCSPPVAVTEPAAAARAVAEAARGSKKPVLAAWLGDINPNESRAHLDAHGIAELYTPENAVEAFSPSFAPTSATRRNSDGTLAARPPGARSARRPRRGGRDSATALATSARC